MSDLPRHRVAPASDQPLRHVVLVTGASSGFGRAAVLQLLRRGDTHVVLVARRRDQLEETVLRAGSAAKGRTSIIVADLVSAEGVHDLAERVRREHPGLTALVNNAGAGALADVFDRAAGPDTQRVLALNLVAPILLVHELVDLLQRSQGAIVNVSSVAGLVGTPKSPVYSASKWGLVGFTEALRARCDPLGIRVIDIQPGPAATEGFPNAHVVRSPWRRLIATDTGRVAAAIEAAACGTGAGRASVVLPRTYRAIPVLRGVAPWLLGLLVGRVGRAVSRAHRPASATPAAGAEAP
jgi:NAD(P)-dependent dehydrogenase (short-subunit alcohol dehydrogenase family)